MCCQERHVGLLLSKLLASGSFLRSCENRFDHRSLGIGVVLHVFPVLACKLPLGALVELTIGGIATQPIAEKEHTLDLRATRREDMQVNVGVWSLEHTVLVPIGLADP